MSNKLTEYLVQFYDELEAKEFYRNIFPVGSFQQKNQYEKFKYNGIIVEITKEKKQNGKPLIYRHTLTDDLDKIDEVCSRDNFCLMSAVDYVGKTRDTANARNLYALVIEIDELKMVNDIPYGIMNLFKQFGNGILPKPTYVVSSGNGLHLYFLLQEPVKLYPNILKQFEALKRELTRKMWHDSISSATPNGHKVQYEPVCQGFRVVGTITRKGTRTRSFEVGEPVTVDYLNEFVSDNFKVKDLAYKHDLSLAEAKEKYPQWYTDKVINKKPNGSWCLNRAVYEWWRNQLETKAECGHRYWCLWILAVYAKKCSFYDEKKNPNPVTLEELQRDSISFLDVFDSKTNGEFEPFTSDDVLASLKGFDSAFVTFPINSIIYKSGITFEKNKRNYQKQNEHLEEARAIRDIRMRRQGKEWFNKDGRPKGSGTAQAKVNEWRANNPQGTKAECNRQTKLDPKTIRKWWN